MHSYQTTLNLPQEETMHGICDACNVQKKLITTYNPFQEIISGIYNSYYKIGGRLVPINKPRGQHW